MSEVVLTATHSSRQHQCSVGPSTGPPQHCTSGHVMTNDQADGDLVSSANVVKTASNTCWLLSCISTSETWCKSSYTSWFICVSMFFLSFFLFYFFLLHIIVHVCFMGHAAWIKQAAWPPGVADTVFLRPCARTQHHRPLLLSVTVDSACSIGVPVLKFLSLPFGRYDTLLVSAEIEFDLWPFDLETGVHYCSYHP